MSEPPIQQTLVQLRFAVGLLGEKSTNGWWPTSFLDASSNAFLDPVFVRTGLLAQFHGVTEAARRIHDARLGVGNFHLFRLPEESEQDLHGLVLDWSRLGKAPISSDASSAMSILDELAAGEGVDAPGPKLLGPSDLLPTAVAWRQVAAAYRDGFRKGFQSFPYFSRA